MSHPTVAELTSADQHELTAYHEAGHAVVARALGFEIGGISMVEDGNTIAAVTVAVPVWLREVAEGRTPNNFPCDHDSRLLAYRQAMVSLSGCIAETFHDENRADRWQVGSSADWEQASNLAEHFYFDLADVENSVREIFHDEERWQQVQAVAARLTPGTFLHPDQVFRIMFQNGGRHV